jgi:Cu2+-exporting ATPase
MKMDSQHSTHTEHDHAQMDAASHSQQGRNEQHGGNSQHAGHDKHAGHDPDMFKRCLLHLKSAH